MDISRLDVFISLASSLHYGRTASKHNMTPSTLSRFVQRLEEEAGTTLFERDNRKVSLTPAGQHYLEFARQTLNAWDVFQKHTGTLSQDLRGEVSLYCSVTASHRLLNSVLAAVREGYPAIDIRLHTGDQALSLQRLKDEQDDFVIAAKPEQLPSNIAFKRLSSSELVFIAPRDDGVVQQQLKLMLDSGRPNWHQFPWILAERGLSREYLDRWFRRLKIKPTVYAQVTGHEAIVSMVSLGCGIGFVPKLVLSSSPASDKIQVVPASSAMLNYEFERFEVGLCVLKRRLQSPLIAALWDTIPTSD